MPLNRKLQQLVDELSVIDDPQERLSLLVDRSRKTPPLPAAERTEANLIPGCVSVVWVVGEVRNGLCYFRSDAESAIVRALVGFLCEFFSGFTPETLLAGDPDPLDALGLARTLSPTRRNGLNATRSAIRAFAARARSADQAATRPPQPPP
ncbi:MAG TPA: SufE family protein [Opitutaceae bacterium]|nr:SufE family protein [Opitutaceae bacterium]